MIEQRPPYVIADSEFAAERIQAFRAPSPLSDVMRIVAIALFLGIISTLAGVGLFVASLPAEQPVSPVHYFPADRGGS